jgi:hypothetical protein
MSNKEWREHFNRNEYHEITGSYLLVIEDAKRKFEEISKGNGI